MLLGNCFNLTLDTRREDIEKGMQPSNPNNQWSILIKVDCYVSFFNRLRVLRIVCLYNLFACYIVWK